MQDNSGMEGRETVELEGLENTPTTEAKQEKPAKLPMKNQYHGYPKEWDKSMAGYNTRMEMEQVSNQATFHRIALNEVRKVLGPACKHISHVMSPEGLSFRAKMIIKGKLTTVNVATEAQEGADLKAEDYKNLKDVLTNELGS